MKKKKYYFTTDELYNPQPDLSANAAAYGRLSTAKQWVDSPESAKAQTIMLLDYMRSFLKYKNDGTTGIVTLFVENQMAQDGEIKDASGTWPIDKRTGMKTILDLVEDDKIKLIAAEDVARLFRDEDSIDSNVFIKVCREHGCFVHITSKHMTYNFENKMHRDMFRLEVQIAASYIENHIRGVMLRRKNQMRDLGLWVGTGSIPVNFLVDNRQGSKTFDKFVLYHPHSSLSVGYYDRLIEVGFNMDILCRELSQNPFLYPRFEDWVYKDFRVFTNMKHSPGGEGYNLSRRGLEAMFCNITNIGALKINYEGREKIMWDNHHSIFGEQDDQSRFWLVYDHFKDKRPDGSPTGRKKLVRFVQKATLEKDPDSQKPLLDPVTSIEDACVNFNRNGHKPYYRIGKRKGLIPIYLMCVQVSVIEELVISRLFERIREADLSDLKARHNKRRVQFIKRLKKISAETNEINSQIENLTANLKQITTPAVVIEIGKSMERILERKDQLVEEEQGIKRALNDSRSDTFEEELQHLEKFWMKKSFEFRKGLLDLILEEVVLDQVAPVFLRVTLKWSYGEWGQEETFLFHDEGSRKRWTDDEEDILQSTYHSTNSRNALLQVLPTRSWKAIISRSHLKNVSEHDKHWDGKLIDRRLSWDDRLWLAAKGWSLDMFLNGNCVGWSGMSDSI